MEFKVNSSLDVMFCIQLYEDVEAADHNADKKSAASSAADDESDDDDKDLQDSRSPRETTPNVHRQHRETTPNVHRQSRETTPNAAVTGAPLEESITPTPTADQENTNRTKVGKISSLFFS